MATKQTIKNTANRRQEQIRQTVGGSNNLAQNSNSRFDAKHGADKIPVLNVSEYQNLQQNVNPLKNIISGSTIFSRGGDENYNQLQELTPLYNELQARNTQNQLERLGQTDIARGASDALVEDIKNQGQGNLLQRYLSMPYSAPNVISNLIQNATSDKTGNLTPEMQALGITEDDLKLWNERQNEAERQEVLSQWAKDNPVASTINAVPENAFQSLSNTLKQIKDYATGTPLQTRETNADIYRRAVAEDIDSNVGQLAYSGVNSLADMLFATLLTAPLGGIGGGANAARNVSRAAGAIMGSEKANQVINSAIERGLTPNQIIGEGIGSGVSTALTEALPLEGILGGNHILSSMLSEGGQEALEDLVDTAIDELITRMGGNGDKSELHQNYNAYLEAGYDADEAFKNMLVDYGKQVGIDALLGGITGGLMGGGSNLMQGRNPITGRIPTLNTDVNENVDNVNVNNDAEIPTVNVEQNVSENSAITDNAQEQHTPEQNRVIQEYNNSSDEKVAEWINARRNGEYTAPIRVASVTDEVANFINNELGIPTYGNDVVMLNSSFDHIDKEHMGNKNKSPMTDEDLSRIGYVLENPDEIAKTGRKTTVTRLSDNSPAPTFILRKRIDGHYYVVEAATDAKNKRNVVMTAFVERVGKEKEAVKNYFKESYHVPNALASASPSANVQNVHEFGSSNERVTRTEDNVNPNLRSDTIPSIENEQGNEQDVENQNIPSIEQPKVEQPKTQRTDKYESVPGLTYGMARITDGFVDIDGYSNKKSEKSMLTELAKAIEKYSKTEADGLRDSIRFNEITQYPGSPDNNSFILEWEENPSAVRTVDADGVDIRLSNRDDIDDNYTDENKPARYYVHIRFPQEVQKNLKRSELTQYRRQMEGLKDKLSTFGNKKDADRLAKSYDAIANSEGDKQAKAIEKFNKLVDSINEKMAGKTVGYTAQDVNSDLYNDMKRVTDGYTIKVTEPMVKALGVSNITELNDKRTYTGKNSIKFRYGSGTPIDSAYMEMYDLANGNLPSPENQSPENLLQFLYDYITDAKAARDELTYEQSWEDTPVTDNRSDAVRKIEDMADDLYDKIEDGISTAEDFSAIMDEINALVKKNPSMRQWCYDTYMELSNALREKVSNADVYDPDINDADLEDLDVLAEEALEGYDDADLESEEIVEEIPRLHNQSSGVHTGRYKQSDVYENSGRRSGIVNDKMDELDKKFRHMMYEQNSERESMQAAQKALNEKGEDAETQRLYNSNDWSNVDIDEAMMLSKQALEEAQNLDAQGLDSDEAWGYVYMWFEKIKEIGSRTGQELQAFAKWSRSNTPEGLLAETTAIISKANGWNKDVANVTRNANRMKFDNGKPQLERSMDINFMKRFLTEASKLKDLPVNSFEYKRVYDNLGKLVNTQIRAGAVEKVRTLLMDNMLGNARTLLTRNAGGNVGFNLIEQLLRRPLSAAIDAGLSKVRNTRRTQGVSREGYRAWGKGAKEAFKQEWYDFTHGVHSGRSGEVNLANATAQNRTVFKNNKTQSTKGEGSQQRPIPA